MDLSLQMELKATVVSEESEEYYEQWVKKDKKTRKKFGLTVSYDMGWQRRSSGNNYASLSGHGFLVGAHTRRVIACVVFSKKCSVCEQRKRKAKCAGITSASPPPPAVITSAGASNNNTGTPAGTGTPPPPVGITSAGDQNADTGTPAGTTSAGRPNDTGTPPPPAGITSAGAPNTDTGTPAGITSAGRPNDGITAAGMDNLMVEDTEDPGDATPNIPQGSLDTSDKDHYCTYNYEGGSGAMESDGLLLLMKKIQKQYDGQIFLDYDITDDDTKMKKYITHPKYRPRGKKNIGGSLPVAIPEPNWYADPTHRAKCVAGSFFDLTKGKKSDQLSSMHFE